MVALAIGTFNWMGAILLTRMGTTTHDTTRGTATDRCLMIETLAIEALDRGRDPFFSTKKIPAEP